MLFPEPCPQRLCCSGQREKGMVQKGRRPPATLPRKARLSYCDANPAPPSPAMTDYSLDINIPTMAVRHEGQPSWQPWYPPAGPPSVPPASLQGTPLLASSRASPLPAGPSVCLAGSGAVLKDLALGPPGCSPGPPVSPQPLVCRSWPCLLLPSSHSRVARVGGA